MEYVGMSYYRHFGVEMRAVTFARCESEAKRFLALAAKVCKHNECNMRDGKEAAALKRASMDLTRALADLRQGR